MNENSLKVNKLESAIENLRIEKSVVDEKLNDTVKEVKAKASEGMKRKSSSRKTFSFGNRR